MGLALKDMEMPEPLSSSLEDYLEAIAELTTVNGHAHTKEIAARLNVKMPSVTGALRQLNQMGYIIYNAHYPVELTESGAEAASKIMHRHNVLKSFFANIMGLSPEKASETACHIEHVVDADTIRRFIIFSDAISNRTDAAELQKFLTEAMAEENRDLVILATVPAGTRAVFVKTGGNIPADTGFPLPPETLLKVQGKASGNIIVSTGGESLEIPAETAENIWCRQL